MVDTQRPYICHSTITFTFCAPTSAGGHFYAIVPSPPYEPPTHAANIMHSYFPGARAEPILVTEPPKDLPRVQKAKVYEIDAFIPAFVRTRLGERDSLVGPNSFQTALAVAGIPDKAGRHVGRLEFEYAVRRSFRATDCDQSEAGQRIAVFAPKAEPFSAGDHAIFCFVGAVCFHKPDGTPQTAYEMTPLSGAIASVAATWRPHPGDRTEGPVQNPWVGRTFTRSCYEPLWVARTHSRGTLKETAWFLPLLTHYNRRLTDAQARTWADFAKHRIDLVTVETMMELHREFGEYLKRSASSMAGALFLVDEGTARAFVELDSRLEHYAAQIATYDHIHTEDPRVEASDYERLYREHLVTFDARLDEEMNLYLKLWNVPQEKWAGIRQAMVAKIRSYDPVVLAREKGRKKIPFLRMLREFAGIRN